jgi:hypothetical protein
VHLDTVDSAGTLLIVCYSQFDADTASTSDDVISARSIITVHLVTVDCDGTFVIVAPNSQFVADSASTSDDVISARSISAVHLVTVNSTGTLIIVANSRFVADTASTSDVNRSVYPTATVLH